MKDKRPVNLDITTIKQPVAAIASITHRVTGVFLFAGVAYLLYLFDLSLDGEAGFERAREVASSFPFRFLLWVVLAAFAYHLVAGVRHLLMDAGIGEGYESGPRGARIVFIISAVLIVALGVWLW